MILVHGQNGYIGVTATRYLVNQGEIRANVASASGIRIFGFTRNENLIEADNGGRLQIEFGIWTNTGTLRAVNNGTLDVGGSTTTAGLQASEAVTDAATSTIRWFGGHSAGGVNSSARSGSRSAFITVTTT